PHAVRGAVARLLERDRPRVRVHAEDQIRAIAAALDWQSHVEHVVVTDLVVEERWRTPEGIRAEIGEDRQVYGSDPHEQARGRISNGGTGGRIEDVVANARAIAGEPPRLQVP